MMPGLDLVDWPADKTLALSGSAADLKLPLVVRHGGVGVRPMGEVSFSDVRLVGGGPPLRLEPLPMGLNLAGDGVTRTQLRLHLDSATPPGRYEGKVRLGELTRTVSIEVLPETKLVVRPAPVVVDAGARATHRFDVAFENRGNIPLTIDLAGDYALGEEIPIAPKPVKAGGSTEDRLAALLDTLIGREAAPNLKPFGTAGLKQPDGQQVLTPGENRVIAVELTLPSGLSPTARYHLFAPLYAADLHLVIVTAAKSVAPRRAARRSKGAAA
jgi:hypothetical protein